MDADGFIALQVHSGKAGKIRFRNLLLKELPTTPWQPLFNGKNLDGWKKIGGGDWKVVGGVLHGTSRRTRSATVISSHRRSMPTLPCA